MPALVEMEHRLDGVTINGPWVDEVLSVKYRELTGTRFETGQGGCHFPGLSSLTQLLMHMCVTSTDNS